MSTWSIVLPIKAIGKGRPRFGQGRTFTPKATLSAEAEVAWYLRAAAPTIHTGPVGISVQVRWRRPRSAPKSRRHPTTRPDVDNVLKLICDAANGILWEDDAQVCDVRVTKSYAEADGVTLEVWGL